MTLVCMGPAQTSVGRFIRTDLAISNNGTGKLCIGISN